MRFGNKSNLENIIETLQFLNENIEDKTVKSKILWAIEKISSNKLYDPLIESGGGGKDASNWIEMMASTVK